MHVVHCIVPFLVDYMLFKHSLKGELGIYSDVLLYYHSGAANSLWNVVYGDRDYINSVIQMQVLRHPDWIYLQVQCKSCLKIVSKTNLLTSDALTCWKLLGTDLCGWLGRLRENKSRIQFPRVSLLSKVWDHLCIPV